MTNLNRIVPAILYIIGVSTPAVAAEAQPDSLFMPPLEDVVVTGSNNAVGRNLIPYTVSVVDGRMLEATGSTQLLSAISGQVPSLFVSQRNVFGFGVSNGGSGHIKMRGVGGDRASAVLMMVDGQPQYAGIYSHHVADFYSKDYVEKVEVLRGPGSVLYGSNAMAGVINVITRNAETDGVTTSLTSEYGSYNTWLSTLTNTTRFGKFTSLLSVSYDRTDGTVENFDFKQWSGYAKFGYEFSRHWKGYADYTLMNFKGNDPIYPRLSNPESTDIYHQNITRGETSATITNRYGDTNGSGRIYYSYGNHFIDDPRHFHSKDDRFGIIVYQNIVPWRNAAMTVGFDFDTYSGAIPTSGGTAHKPGALATMERKRIVEYSPYITLSQELAGKRLLLNSGVRMSGSDMFHTQWVPQAGFTVNGPGGYAKQDSGAMGYRNPSFRELYLYRMANPELQPEKMMNYEVSLSKSFSHYLSFDVTAYYARGRDMIQVLDNKNVNTGRFINKGIEISAKSNPMEKLHLTASYSYLRTSLANLTGAPMNQYSLGVDWQPLKHLRVSADLKGVGGLFVSDGMRRQNYALLNMKINYDVCRFLSIFTRLENITDARYVINRGYDMPGFTIMGGFKLNFQSKYKSK